MDELESLLFGDERDSGPDAPEYEVDSAYQGEEAAEMVAKAVAEQRPYMLAFVDMRMPPGWDGLKTIEEIWKRDPKLHVVICTAFSDYSWPEIVERLGASDKLLILKKPFDVSEVSQLAAALTRKRWLEEQMEMRLEELEGLVAEKSRSLQQTLLRLRRSEAFLQSTLDALSAGICIIDGTGQIKAVNAAWHAGSRSCRLFGRRIAPGANYLAICRAADMGEDKAGTKLARAIEEVLAGRRKSAWLEYESASSDEAARYFAVRVTQFVSEGERHAVVAHEDITEQKELERHLSQAQKLEAVGQLAAGVAHEINTPLQYVGDNVDYLKRSFQIISTAMRLLEEVFLMAKSGQIEKGKLEQLEQALVKTGLRELMEDIPDTLEDCEQGIASIARIVRAMKEFSHPDTGERAPLDLNQIIESTVTVARNEWKYVADVELALDPDLPTVEGYGDKLRQVFLNLVVNAAHAIGEVVGDGSKGKGKIRIRTRRSGDWAVVEVSDTGVGIPERLKSRIFEPFFTTKPVGKGTGQGLALAHSIVVGKHGGRIEVESEEGKGTTFTVWLPIRPAESAQTGSESPSPERTERQECMVAS